MQKIIPTEGVGLINNPEMLTPYARTACTADNSNVIGGCHFKCAASRGLELATAASVQMKSQDTVLARGERNCSNGQHHLNTFIVKL